MPEGPLSPGGVNAFIELKDTPASFAGQSGKIPTVKATEDELEFTTPAGGGDMLAATYDAAGKSEQLLGESDIVTTVGTPGSDTKIPSEQSVREALNVVDQKKVKVQFYGIIASGNESGTLTKPAGAGADVDFIMDNWSVSVDALLSKVDANDLPIFEPPVNASGAIITTTFNVGGDYALSDTPSPAAKHAIIYVYTCYFKNFLVAESMQDTEWVGDVVYETDFAATSFLYATSKNVPQCKTPTEVRSILNVEGGADVTDAVNVASSIHGVAAKATPVDADEMGLIDSAASWVLKKVTWTNIKATLKTYFDTLYNLYVHPNHTGEVTSAADGAQTITDKAVTLAKMNDMATASLLGRNTAGAGVPEVLSQATVRSLLGVPTVTTAAWSKSIGSGGDYATWAAMIADMSDLIAHIVTITIKAGTTLTETCDLRNKHGLTSTATIVVQAEKYFPTSGELPTADSATATTLRDAALATAALGNDYFNGCWVLVVDGTGTDNGFVLITDYIDATGDVVVASWPGTQPDNTSRYLIVGALIDGGAVRRCLDVRYNTCGISLYGIGVYDSDDYGIYAEHSFYILGYYNGVYQCSSAGLYFHTTNFNFRYNGIVKCNTANQDYNGGITVEIGSSGRLYYSGISDNNQRGIYVLHGSFAYPYNNFGDANGLWGIYSQYSGQVRILGTECSGSSGNHSDPGTAGTANADQASAY